MSKIIDGYDEDNEYDKKLKNAISAENKETLERKYNDVSNVLDFISAKVEDISIACAKSQNLNDAIFLVGPSNVGKSTVTNYIAGVPLVLKKNVNTKKWGLQANDKTKFSEIGIGEGSTTVAPNIYTNIDGFEGIGFIDCAGDFDSRGVIVETINAVARKNIASKCKKAKFVVFINQSDLCDNAFGVTLQKSLSSMKGFLGKDCSTNIKEFKNNIAIIVSRAERQKDIIEAVKGEFDVILKQQSFVDKDILSYVIDKDHFAVFCKPNPEDAENGKPYTPPKGLNDQKDKIIDLIRNKISFNSDIKFNVPISDNIKDPMLKAFDIVKDHVTNTIKLKVEELLRSRKIKVKVSQLEELRKSINSIDNINDSAPILLQEYLEKFDLLKKFGASLDLSTLNKCSEQIKLLSDLTGKNELVNWNISSTRLELAKKVTDEIKEVETEKVEKYNGHDAAKYFGYNVVLSEVKGYVSGKNIKKLNIFALNEVTLDSDINLPGCDLSIVAPKWKINTTTEIYLSGKTPEKASDAGKNSMKNGSEELHGSPGMNSGNFFGVFCSKPEKLNLIELFLNGGDGGNGTDASEKVYYGTPETVSDKKHSLQVKKGYPGGRGGDSGIYNFFDNKQKIEIFKSGIANKPGIGGNNGKDIYISKLEGKEYVHQKCGKAENGDKIKEIAERSQNDPNSIVHEYAEWVKSCNQTLGCLEIQSEFSDF